MEKNNLFYFKIAFLMFVPIAVFIIIKGLFDIDLSDFSLIMKLVMKGILVGVLTGLILGLINIFVKIDTLSGKKNK